MKLFVPKETDASESRVAASPDTVKKLTALGFEVCIEDGAGNGSRISNADYKEAGATIGKAANGKNADVVLKVRRPSPIEAKSYKKGAIIIATLDPFGNEGDVKAMAKAGLSAFAMEFMPRITRAQSMDVLSSQANLAGYQAVIEAAETYDRALPMMMTAAGTVPAAKVFVMGVGVAGLQAIATARRLGAIVTATDVRPATKEQVESVRNLLPLKMTSFVRLKLQAAMPRKCQRNIRPSRRSLWPLTLPNKTLLLQRRSFPVARHPNW